MSRILDKKVVFKTVFAAWLVLWVIFLIREDKDGQYGTLRYLYTHGYDDKLRHIMGNGLYEFLIFCRQNIPEGSTYELTGFERFSVSEVRARYFLWPLKDVGENADFKIVYGKEGARSADYKEYKRYSDTGYILVKKIADR